MVRNYVKKGLRQTWTDDAMRTALEAVIKNGYSIKRAAVVYEVPHATLSRKVNQCRLDPEKQNELLANPKAISNQTVFTKEQENTLCEYISELENTMVGLVGTDVRRLAFQLAEKFQIPHRFKKDSGIAGEDWYRGFIKRNPHIKVKRGETPYEKSRAFSKEKVYKFFDSLESCIDKYDLKPSDLYNLDESVIKCSSKSVRDSEKNVTSKQSQDKLVTAVISFSATGAYVPLLMVFPDKVKNKPLLHGAPHAAWALVNSSGQVHLDIFIRWLRKFIDVRKPTKVKPVLILVDGYHSYLKNLDVLEIMTEHGVHILCLPPNCSSKLQPSKCSFMNILSAAYKDEVTKWTTNSAEESATVDEVFQLFGNAFKKVSSISAAESSFLITGVWPCNRDLFKHEFISVTLNIPSAISDSHSTSESSVSIVDDECQAIHNDVSIPNQATDDLHEPMIVLSQNNMPSYELQEINQMDPSYGHPVQEGHFLQVENESFEMLLNDNQTTKSSIVIPPEAQLTEIELKDIQSLSQSQRKLYFYVSPYKLKLS